jgi:N-acetylglutamate synthase-like GNAT family acetyltransferase
MPHGEYRIRPYKPSDRSACLALFDSNTPDFFAPRERDEFAGFLDDSGATMLVLETTAGELIGCGGYYMRAEGKDGGLAWGMIHRRWHRRGAGRTLLRSRLRALQTAGAKSVTVHTSRHSRGFFEREGFEEVRVVPDGFASGIDMVELRLQPLFRNHDTSVMF